MSRSPRRSRGFTLVEILVVVAIIVILMAILIPVAMGMISRARNAAIGVELSQLATALKEYKKDHGDYPPSMGGPPTQWLPANRYGTVAERHLLRCYPKMDPAQKDFFYTYIAPYLGNDESLVFWLATIANDPRAPFKNYSLDGSGNVCYAPQPGSPSGTVGIYPGPYSRFVHYEFDDRRIGPDLDNDRLLSYQAPYCRNTPFVYMESRTYKIHMHGSYPAVGIVQPLMDSSKVLLANINPDTAFVNPDTFQIHCAGQDGVFADPNSVFTAVDNNFSWLNNWQTIVKVFPNDPGLTNAVRQDEHDNMMDFTEGRKLIDHRAP